MVLVSAINVLHTRSSSDHVSAELLIITVSVSGAELLSTRLSSRRTWVD